MKKILLTGSIAYDHIMSFDGEFTESLIPSKFRDLSVSFIASSHKKHFGGCVCNIAYNLNLLGDKPFIFGVAGNDFEPYEKWLLEQGISPKFIEIDPENLTASAFIISDVNNNQITIFSPDAMKNLQFGMNLGVTDPKSYDLVMISPGEPHRMLSSTQYCINNEIPYIFDPGQAVPSLSNESILTIIENSNGVFVNSYEGSLIERKLSMSLTELSYKTGFIVRTIGADGCELYVMGNKKNIPGIPDLIPVDTTGGGDAFRAGFLHGYSDANSLEHACEVGNTAASFVLEYQGTQNHNFTPEEFKERMTLNFGETT